MLVIGDALAMVLLEARGFGRDDFAALHPGGSLGRSLLTKVTTKAFAVSVLRDTRAVVAPAPAPSEIDAASMIKVSSATSLSVRKLISAAA